MRLKLTTSISCLPFYNIYFSNMNKIYLFVLSFILFSCSSKKNEEYEILQVSLIESEMAITDLFKDFEVIPLETTDNSLLIWPDKVMCIDDNYAVFDSRHPAVFLFDDGGQFIRKIGNRGEGPHDYYEIYDVLYNPIDKTIEMLSPFGDIVSYTLEGNWVRKIKFPQKTNYQSFVLNDSSYVAWSVPSNMNDYGISIISQDGSMLINSLWQCNPNLSLLYPRVFYQHKDEVYFYRPFGREVYKISDNGMGIAYEWDFGKNNYTLGKWDIDLYKISDENENQLIMNLLREGHIPYVFSKQNQSESYYYANLVFGFTPSGNQHLFFDKRNGKTFFFNKTNEGINFFPLYMGNDFILIKIDTPQIPFLREIISEIDYETIANRVEDDNPIILKCYYK